MLNSCASNVVVVNIDAGIQRRPHGRPDRAADGPGPAGRRAGRAGGESGRPGGRTGQALLNTATRPIRRSAGEVIHGTGTDRRDPEARTAATRRPQGAVWHGAGHRRGPRDGRRGGASAAARRLRSGAGLVRVATAAEVQPVVASFEPSYMTYPAPLRRGRADRLRPVAAGPPGPDRAGRRRRGRAGTRAVRTTCAGWSEFLIAETDQPLVIDADGLNVLAGQTELLAGRKHPVVITPHPGRVRPA